jgi:RNA polymerase sigma factor (sigma-70 family)
MVNMAEVCEANRGLVYAVAKRFYAVCAQDRAVDPEDLAQAGYVGLIEAARTYDETKGMFSTWAVVYIRNEIRAALGLLQRSPGPGQGLLSLDAEIGEGITLADTLEAPDDIEEEVDHTELVRVVRETVAALPAPQNELVRLHDLRGRNLSAAGRACGLTASAANSAYVRARENLYRNARLRALAGAHNLDLRTNWHRHVGLEQFRSTWTSSTEALAFWREAERRKTKRFAARASRAAVGVADTDRRETTPKGAARSQGLSVRRKGYHDTR